MQVYLSPLAAFKLQKLFAYLDEHWGESVRRRFQEQLNRFMENLSRFPGICPKMEEFPNLHRCVVTQQNSLVYRVNDDAIEVVTVFDNRQDPERIWKEIREYFGKGEFH
jgi:plasmid stabilization system protein ParE